MKPKHTSNKRKSAQINFLVKQVRKVSDHDDSVHISAEALYNTIYKVAPNACLFTTAPIPDQACTVDLSCKSIASSTVSTAQPSTVMLTSIINCITGCYVTCHIHYSFTKYDTKCVVICHNIYFSVFNCDREYFIHIQCSVFNCDREYVINHHNIYCLVFSQNT